MGIRCLILQGGPKYHVPGHDIISGADDGIPLIILPFTSASLFWRCLECHKTLVDPAKDAQLTCHNLP